MYPVLLFYAQIWLTCEVTSMLKAKRKELQKDRNKLKNGLDKLQQTNEVVAMLQKELSLMQPELTKKAAATETLLKQIREDQATADGVRRVVMEEEAVIFDSTVKTQVKFIESAKKKLPYTNRELRPSRMKHKET